MDIRATCLNCMDGRVQLPILNWIMTHCEVNFVDMITEAGMDAVLSKQKNIDEILRSIKVSVDLNKSSRLFVVGHHDCRGNPVDKKAHHAQIVKAVKRVKGHWKKHEVTGLWVNQDWQVQKVISQ